MQTSPIEIFKNSAIAILQAIFANAALYFTCRMLGGLPDDLIPTGGDAPITIVPILMITTVPMIIGTLIYLGLTRIWPANAFKIFSILSIVIFVAYIFPPLFFVPDANWVTVLFLELMHIPPVAFLLYRLK